MAESYRRIHEDGVKFDDLFEDKEEVEGEEVTEEEDEVTFDPRNEKH